VTASAEPFQAEGDRAAVRGFLHRPPSAPRDGIVLTHGAGGNCQSPLLVALATAFAGAGLAALRCDLPFRQSRPKGPPSPAGAERDRDGLREAARALREVMPGRVFLGGASYGGRQASIAVADDAAAADGLLLLSYPLHPPGRARDLRTGHFPRVRARTLFAHGTVDPFASIEELEAARALIPGPTALVVIDGAGHGLGRGPRAPQPAPETVARIIDAFAALVDAAI